ncbi:MAG: hypothetical protein LC790_21525 [Actinobacteria bacterium]|nr:hypothetical protein [Actinomycetota bacterium]
MERLASGAAGLDEVLCGGLPANAINLIVGLPGSGKTLLAQQYVFTNATVERPAVYLATVSEPFEKIVRYGQGLSFFDTDAVGEGVFYEDVGAALLEGGLGAVLERVKDVLEQYEPGVLVIDSFKPFASFAESPSEHRGFVHELAARLSVRAVTSFWIGEYSAAEMSSAAEFAVTLVAGPSGAGKTVLGLHFVFAGVRRGESTVLATLEENPSQLARAASGFGWSLQAPEVHLMYRSAVDLYLDEWVYDLLELIDSQEARRVFIDGLANLRAAAEPVRFREYLYSLVQRCSRQGVNLMMSIETAELFGATRLTEGALSQMADSVVLLQFLRRDGEYRRAMTILKSRGAKMEPRMHVYTIGATGIELTGRGGADRPG